jgi:hypothetical protein
MKRILLTLVSLGVAAAQPIPINLDWDALAAKAVEKVEVNVSPEMLQLGAKFLGQSKPGEKDVSAMLSGLKGVWVRSLKFAKEGEYSQDELQKFVSKVAASGFSPMVNVAKSGQKAETAAVLIRQEAGKITGTVIVAGEPRELTVVQILGSIDPQKLAGLGVPGIPKMHSDFSGSKPSGGKPKDE